MHKHWFLGTAFLLLQLPASAKENQLDSVIIRQNRIQEPYGRQNRNIQLLDAKQIATLPVKSVNELLSYVAGVDLRQRGPSGTQADISIDGSSFDEVLVMVNGVKMSDPQTGHHMMNLPIPLSSIDHVEVLRGPAAMIYGVNALAGAVNIVTRTPVQNEVSAQVYAGSSFKSDSSNGDSYYGWGAQASASLAGKNQGHILSVGHDEGTGYRYNTAYSNYRLFYQDHFDFGKRSKLEATGGYIHNDFGANGYYSAPGDVNSKEKVETALGSIAYTYTPNDKVMIRPRVSYRYNSDDYIYVKQNPELYHNQHETYVMTAEVQSTVKIGKGILGAGVEYRNDRINSKSLGQRDRNNVGISAEYKYYFSDKLNAGAGVYGNYNDNYDWQLFPGVDAGYRFAKNWKVYANATMGERLPTYTDLYYKGPANIGNANLNPEYSQYAEGGLRYQTTYIWLQGAYFYKHITNFIDWVRANPLDPWQPMNFQAINTPGVTVTANYSLSDQLAMRKGNSIVLNANYTYLDPMIQTPTTESSKYSIEALKHQATFSVRTLWWNKLQVNANARYLYRISANDYTLLDARVCYQFKHWNIYADVNNILDTQYKEIGSVPMPGRWYTLGVRLNTPF
ncbi:MAG: hypothetical protein BGO70_00750 [Bacteroidetes bacterium 43-93]|nr:TonB-dependent receptor [Bacteroidota bacterium]OJW96245.1 MAG: hypothetical protein BGO70_00750 [Bacteroidetes bacterium 43-93]